jgi:hypothetical protein
MKMKTPLLKLVIAAMCVAATIHPGSILAQVPPGQPALSRQSGPSSHPSNW